MTCGVDSIPEIGGILASTVCASRCVVPWFLVKTDDVQLTANHAFRGALVVILLLSVFLTIIV